MKRIVILTAIFTILFTGLALANTVRIPGDVKEIKSATYSTGGGENMIVYIKVHCLMQDGREVLFLAGKASVSGMLGFGRWTLPEKIEFIRDKSLKDRILWK